MTDVNVQCDGSRAAGWTCAVVIREDDRHVTTHGVRVRVQDLERLAPGADDPTALVRASFLFLLERESPSSILRSFDLMTIARYFPDYPAEIGGRLGT